MLTGVSVDAFVMLVQLEEKTNFLLSVVVSVVKLD